jgi:hypothetical protein
MLEPPRWLIVVAGLTVINGGLVAISLLQRHLGTEPRLGTESIQNVGPTGMTVPLPGEVSQLDNSLEPTVDGSVDQVPGADAASEVLRAQQRLNQLPVPQITPSSLPVSDQDPLMQEIRQQAAEQFGELLIKPNER